MEKLKQLVFEFIWKYFAGCNEVTELASRQLDGEKLPWHKRVSMHLHVLSCQGCQNYLSQIKFMREAFSQNSKDKTSATLSPNAKERLKNAIKTANLPKLVL